MELVSKSAMFLGQDNNDAEIKKEYNPPLLEKLGDLRSVTLGGSVGTLESGVPFGSGDPFNPFATPTP